MHSYATPRVTACVWDHHHQRRGEGKSRNEMHARGRAAGAADAAAAHILESPLARSVGRLRYGGGMRGTKFG